MSSLFQRWSLPFVRSYFIKSLGLSPFWQYWSSSKQTKGDGREILLEAGKSTFSSNLKWLILFKLEHPWLRDRYVTVQLVYPCAWAVWKVKSHPIPSNYYIPETNKQKIKHCFVSFLTCKTNVGWFWLENVPENDPKGVKMLRLLLHTDWYLFLSWKDYCSVANWEFQLEVEDKNGGRSSFLFFLVTRARQCWNQSGFLFTLAMQCGCS